MLHTGKHDKREERKSGYVFVVTLMVLLLCLLVTACDFMFGNPPQKDDSDASDATGPIYEIRNNNVPYFDDDNYAYAEAKGAFSELSPLDDLDRVGVCWGLFDYDHMPTYDREQLYTKPTGWHQKKIRHINRSWWVAIREVTSSVFPVERISEQSTESHDRYKGFQQ